MEMKHLQDQKNPNLKDKKKSLHGGSSNTQGLFKRQLGMGLSLKERYQGEALKEGKKIVASTWSLARDLREVERWGSKEQRG